MRTYDTVSEAVNDLVKRGYTDNLATGNECIVCETKSRSLNPEEFEIDEFYRFEGNTDPADETIVYAISSHDNHIKGILVNAFGPYADTLPNKMIEKLKLH